MKKTSIIPALTACLAALGIASQNNCRAQSSMVIQSLNSPGGAITNVNTSATFGYSFTLGSMDATLTQLGIWDKGGGAQGEAHEVALWSSTGTLLASVTIPSGSPASLINGFSFADVGNVSLTAGTTYVLGFYDDSVNTDSITFRQTSTLGTDVASIGNPLLINGSSLAFPTTSVGGNVQGFFGPDAIFTVTPVPEPSTLALVALGGLLLFRRRKV